MVRLSPLPHELLRSLFCVMRRVYFPGVRVFYFGIWPPFWRNTYLYYTSLNRLYFSVFGGEGGIWTLARFYPPNPLAGGPLWPLGYLANYINYEIKKQPCGWCKKLLIDIVFCSICFRNIWKRIYIPLTILLWNYMLFIVGLWIA